MAGQEAAPQVELRVLPQDPHAAPPVTVHGPLLAGRIGDRIAVFDYHRARGLRAAPTVGGDEGGPCPPDAGRSR